MILKLKPYLHDQAENRRFVPKRAPMVFLSPAKRPFYALFVGGFCEIKKDGDKWLVPSVDGQLHPYDFDVVDALMKAADADKMELIPEEKEAEVKAEAEVAVKRAVKRAPLVRVGGQ